MTIMIVKLSMMMIMRMIIMVIYAGLGGCFSLYNVPFVMTRRRGNVLFVSVLFLRF